MVILKKEQQKLGELNCLSWKSPGPNYLLENLRDKLLCYIGTIYTRVKQTLQEMHDPTERKRPVGMWRGKQSET